MDMILKLLRADIGYTIRRLLPADLKGYASLLGGESVPTEGDNPFYDDFVMAKNTKYGGVDVAPFLTYNW
jgi:hypothetical protein